MEEAVFDGSVGNQHPPALSAKVIDRAAVDRTERLRYTAQPGPYLLMHQLLPDRLWRSLVGMALNTHARNPSSR